MIGMNGRRDVRILAPTAQTKSRAGIPGQRPPTPEELCQLLSVENQELQAQIQQGKVAAGTMANLALCFAQMLVDHNVMQAGDRTVRVPRFVYERVDGMTITVSPEAIVAGGDVIVKIRERPEGPKVEA